MSKRSILSVPLFVMFMLGPVISADRVLERREILGILESLTARPYKTWIAAGTIAGELEEYRAPKLSTATDIVSVINQRESEYLANPDKLERVGYLQAMRLAAIPFNTRYELLNEYTMRSSESVTYDGRRFYWDVRINTRNDSVRPDASLAGNDMTDEFDTMHNTSRTFVWDGFTYKLYTPSANHLFEDAADTLPHPVNGPLTAGIIPWGYGRFTYEGLSSQQIEGIEISIDRQSQIALTVRDNSGSTLELILDPALNYAVLSSVSSGRGDSVSSRFYSNFQEVAGRWVPRAIVLERHDATSQRLLMRDIWTITRIDTAVPSAGAFDVRVKDGTNVEYTSPVGIRSVMYQHSAGTDMQALLAEKLHFEANRGTRPQNCATAALKYAFSQLGMSVASDALVGLITEAHQGSNLQIMKRFVDKRGAHCRAIKTDIASLVTTARSADCQIILYLPGNQHFIVLDSPDRDNFRIVDLASRRFYYQAQRDVLERDWSTGVALLLSRDVLVGEFRDLDDEEMGAIAGAAEGMSCTDQVRWYSELLCNDFGGICSGWAGFTWPRWRCETGQPGDSCSHIQHCEYTISPCVMEDLIDCGVTGNWSYGWIEACR